MFACVAHTHRMRSNLEHLRREQFFVFEKENNLNNLSQTREKDDEYSENLLFAREAPFSPNAKAAKANSLEIEYCMCLHVSPCMQLNVTAYRMN